MRDFWKTQGTYGSTNKEVDAYKSILDIVEITTQKYRLDSAFNSATIKPDRKAHANKIAELNKQISAYSNSIC